jgi:hypothetical protein
MMLLLKGPLYKNFFFLEYLEYCKNLSKYSKEFIFEINLLHGDIACFSQKLTRSKNELR